MWKTVASSAAMLKLALAMISAAFRTTPFSMSMQLCPNATMSLHSPSIFDVVSSITPIMSCIINNRYICSHQLASCRIVHVFLCMERMN